MDMHAGGGATLVGISHSLLDKLEQLRTPWYHPDLHQKIVDAALSGAQAMAQHKHGSLATVSGREDAKTPCQCTVCCMMSECRVCCTLLMQLLQTLPALFCSHLQSDSNYQVLFAV